jgi:hypothetical protein
VGNSLFLAFYAVEAGVAGLPQRRHHGLRLLRL